MTTTKIPKRVMRMFKSYTEYNTLLGNHLSHIEMYKYMGARLYRAIYVPSLRGKRLSHNMDIVELHIHYDCQNKMCKADFRSMTIPMIELRIALKDYEGYEARWMLKANARHELKIRIARQTRLLKMARPMRLTA